MTTVNKLLKLLTILSENGRGDGDLCADHDIIYISPEDEDISFSNELIEAGAIWGEDGWVVFT